LQSDRCFDFFFNFRRKMAKQICVFLLILLLVFCEKCDRNIGFWKKLTFSPKKIAENCDQNIDPWWCCEKLHMM
jgi:hypothetical protein